MFNAIVKKNQLSSQKRSDLATPPGHPSVIRRSLLGSVGKFKAVSTPDAESLHLSPLWYVKENPLTGHWKTKKASNIFDQEHPKHPVSAIPSHRPTIISLPPGHRLR